MPTLRELIGPDKSNYRMDLANVARKFWNDPKGIVTGPVQFGGDMLKGLGRLLLDVPQSISPVQIPGADPMPEDFGGRAKMLANSASIGIIDQLVNAYKESGSVSGAGKKVLYDFSPIDELKRLTSGRDAEGNELSSEQLSQAFTQGLLESIPAVGAVRGIRAAITRGVPPVSVGRTRVVTQAQVDGAVNPAVALQQALKKEVVTSEAPIATEAVVPTVPRVGEPGGLAEIPMDISKRVPEGEALIPLSGKQIAETIEVGAGKVLTDAGLEHMMSLPEGKARAFTSVVRDMKESGMKPEAMVDWAVAKGYNLEDAFGAYINELDQVSSAASRASWVMNEVKKLSGTTAREAHEFLRASIKKTDDPTIKARMEKLLTEKYPTTIYGNIARMYSGFSDTARKAAVTQMVTTMRNSIGQANTGVVQLFENALSDTMLAGTDLVKHGKLTQPIGTHYAEVLGDVLGIAGAMARGTNRVTDYFSLDRGQWGAWFDKYNRINTLLNEELPGEVARVKGAAIAGDVSSGVNAASEGLVRSRLRALGQAEGVLSKADKAIDFMLIPNTFQELEFRRYFYTGRLDANLKRIGVTMENFETALKSGDKLDENLQRAVSDASDHALKQTFSYNPKAQTLGGAVMKIYRDFPFMVGLGPMYPRFLINQYRYLTEHLPTQFLNLLDPKFRKEFSDATNGSLRPAEAARVISRATSGTAMLGSAWYVDNLPDQTDLKYYQFNTGQKDKDGKPIIADLRPYQPFISYKFMARVMRAMGNGDAFPKDLTSAELTDALTGVRNIGDVPIFVIGDLIRTANANEPEEAFKQRIERVGGQLLAMPFIPGRMISDTFAIVGHEASAKAKDTKGDQLLGPLVNNIPIAREILPDLTDPLTGKAVKTEYPAIRQGLGVGLRTLAPMEKLMQTSGLSMGDLIGTWKDPRANNLMREWIGTIMSQSPEDGGQPISDVLANEITKATPLDTDRSERLKDIFTYIRQQALRGATAENPAAFVEDALKNEDSVTKEFLREMRVVERVKRELK